MFYILYLIVFIEYIYFCRKNIAEESAKMLKLKDEATKLSHRYKIVATELKNISTAITLNKKEQRTVQSRLSRIRIHHQKLLNGYVNIFFVTNSVFLCSPPVMSLSTMTLAAQLPNIPKEMVNFLLSIDQLIKLLPQTRCKKRMSHLKRN